jgi:hypothetical protein
MQLATTSTTKNIKIRSETTTLPTMTFATTWNNAENEQIKFYQTTDGTPSIKILGSRSSYLSPTLAWEDVAVLADLYQLRLDVY